MNRRPTTARMMDMGEDFPVAEANLPIPGDEMMNPWDYVEDGFQTQSDFTLRLPDLNGPLDTDEVKNILDTMTCNPTLDSFEAFADEPASGTVSYVPPNTTQNAALDAIQGLIKTAAAAGGQRVAGIISGSRPTAASGIPAQSYFGPSGQIATTVSKVPTWVWFAGGGAALLLVFMMMRRK